MAVVQGSGLQAPAQRVGAGWRLLTDLRYAAWSTAVNGVAGSPLVPRDARRVLYRLAGLAVGKANVYPGVTMSSSRVRLGDRVMVNVGCHFDAAAVVALDDDVALGHDVMLCTSTHDMSGSSRRAGAVVARPIRIGRGSWVGARVVVLPGVTIAPGCVIASGAVVLADTLPDGLYAGVPARRVRDL